MTELSPAARAVLDAAANAYFDWDYDDDGGPAADMAAAALRAAADQVGPSEILPPGYAYSAPAEMWHYEFKLQAQRRIHAIADELEAQ